MTENNDCKERFREKSNQFKSVQRATWDSKLQQLAQTCINANDLE